MPLPSSEFESARVEALFREARQTGDHQRMAKAAAECARIYGALDEPVKECAYLHILGKHQIHLGSYSACLQTVQRLLDSPEIRVDPVLKAQAFILRAAAQRNQGKHAPAIEDAREALRTLENVKGNHRYRAEACQALIASLVEADKIEEAWALRDQLSAALQATSYAKSSGQGYWTLGNLAFAYGHLDEGLEYHAQAAGFLQLANDIRLWARFNKSSADMQLQAGIANDHTYDCIERAQLAYQIIGGSGAEKTDLAMTRARWNCSKGQLDAASSIMEAALGDAGDVGTLESASAHMFWAEILSELGHHAEAESKRRTAYEIQQHVASTR